MKKGDSAGGRKEEGDAGRGKERVGWLDQEGGRNRLGARKV